MGRLQLVLCSELGCPLLGGDQCTSVWEVLCSELGCPLLGGDQCTSVWEVLCSELGCPLLGGDQCTSVWEVLCLEVLLKVPLYNYYLSLIPRPPYSCPRLLCTLLTLKRVCAGFLINIKLVHAHNNVLASLCRQRL